MNNAYILLPFLIYFNSIIPLLSLSFSEKYNNLISWIKENNGYVSKKVYPLELSLDNRIMKSNSE